MKLNSFLSKFTSIVALKMADVNRLKKKRRIITVEPLQP